MNHEDLEMTVDHFGDTAIGGVMNVMFMKDYEHVDEDMAKMLQTVAELHEMVLQQVHHLASVFDGELKNPRDMTEEERQGWEDYDLFEDGHERLVAHAEMAKLHKPQPEDPDDEELEEWSAEETRRRYCRVWDMTVREAVQYLAYWHQERESVKAMQWFSDWWAMERDVAAVVGDKPPMTIGEFMEHLSRKADEEER